MFTWHKVCREGASNGPPIYMKSPSLLHSNGSPDYMKSPLSLCSNGSPIYYISPRHLYARTNHQPTWTTRYPYARTDHQQRLSTRISILKSFTSLDEIPVSLCSNDQLLTSSRTPFRQHNGLQCQTRSLQMKYIGYWKFCWNLVTNKFIKTTSTFIPRFAFLK